MSIRMLGLEDEWIGGSHVDWRRERVLVKTLGLEGGWIEISHCLGGEQNIIYKGMEISPDMF